MDGDLNANDDSVSNKTPVRFVDSNTDTMFQKRHQMSDSYFDENVEIESKMMSYFGKNTDKTIDRKIEQESDCYFDKNVEIESKRMSYFDSNTDKKIEKESDNSFDPEQLNLVGELIGELSKIKLSQTQNGFPSPELDQTLCRDLEAKFRLHRSGLFSKKYI